MSDFQNDEFRRDRSMYDPNARNTSPGGLLAGAAIVAVVIGLLVAFGHPANQGTGSGSAPPPMTHMAPSGNSPAAPGLTPAPAAPARP